MYVLYIHGGEGGGGGKHIMMCTCKMLHLSYCTGLWLQIVSQRAPYVQEDMWRVRVHPYMYSHMYNKYI